MLLKISKFFLIILLLFLFTIIFSSVALALDPIKSVTPISKDVKNSNNQLNDIKSSYSALPRKYDLRILKRVSPVKNQNPAGTCWTFATMGSLESCLLPTEKWSFSENNMKNLCSYGYSQGFNRRFDKGGSYLMSLAYLARYSGPVTTSMDPYNPFSSYSPTNLKAVKHFQKCIIINSDYRPGNVAIKSAVMKYGAVAVNCKGESIDLGPFYNPKFACSYFPGSRDPRKNLANHAVCIVGWDDDYNKNKFKIQPPANGAFIIKNSWGTSYGDKGYCYVSYYDTILRNTLGFVYVGAEKPNNYKDIYQYDPFGLVEFWGSKNIAWFANVFQAANSNKLAAVSFYTPINNTSYAVYIYKNPEKNNPTSGVMVNKFGGRISTMGYYTLPLKGHVPLVQGQTFSVVVKVVSSEKKQIAYEYPNPYICSKARALPGQSYVSMNGMVWRDFTSIIKNGNVCLKAFTI